MSILFIFPVIIEFNSFLAFSVSLSMPWNLLGWHLKETLNSFREINKQINTVYYLNYLNLYLPLYVLLYTSVLKLTKQTEEE